MHIPKTAGMALRLFFGNQYSTDVIMPAANWLELMAQDVGPIDHYRLFQGHFGCGMFDMLPPDTRSVVFLREPVARTISHLKHMRRDPNFHPAHKLAVGRPLEELIRDDAIMALCCNIQVGQLSNDIPGTTILRGLRSELARGRRPNLDAYALQPDLEKAKLNLERFDFVGFVETLQEDVLQLALAMRLHPPAFVAKRNDDPQGETDLAALDQESLTILRERNALDLALYEMAQRRPRLSRRAIGAALLDRAVYAPISCPMRFPISGAIPGSNWYAYEIENGNEHRWTGPSPETTLDLPLMPGHHFEISLSVLLPDLADLSVRIGESDVPIIVHSSEGRLHEISFWIPADAVRKLGLTSVSFYTKRVFRGSDTDIRMLSFRVTQLAITRVQLASCNSSERDCALAPPSAPKCETSAVTATAKEMGLPINPASPVTMLGDPIGVFPDGWVRARALLRLRALAAITSMTLNLWAPESADPLKITIRQAGRPSMDFIALPRAVSTFKYEIQVEPFSDFEIELLASDEKQLSDSDVRHASYVLQGIRLT